MAADEPHPAPTPPHQSSPCADGEASADHAAGVLFGSPTPVIYQFFYILEAEDAQECCEGAESLQGSITADMVQLLCLRCDRIRHCPSHQAEVVI